MVDDAVWASAGMRDGYLCIGCLEGRLGFGLCAADFARVPVNAPNERDSRRLADRKRRAVRAGAVRGCGGHRTLDLVREELDDLAHLADDDGAPYALFGSIVLLHYGLRERIGDVDVFVHPAIWHVLATRAHWRTLVPDPADPPILETHADELKVHAFHRWQQRDHPAVCADECRRRAILASGWWLTPLDLIRQHKAHSLAQPGADSDVRQAKHRRDLALIDAHLEATAWRGGPVIRAGEGGELR